MIKVCHITSVHSAYDVRILYKECFSLAKAGYSVSLIAPGDSCQKERVSIYGIGKLPTSRLKRMLQMPQKAYIEALKIDADIYHLHDPELLPIGIKLLKKGKKVIFDSHEDVAAQINDKEWIPALIRRLVQHYYQIYQKKIFPKYTAIIGASPHICRAIKAAGSENVHLITNYPIVKANSDNKSLAVSRSGNKLVFAGGIISQWMHHTIIEALEQLEGVQYVLCGTAEQEYLNDLQKLDGWNKVDYIGKQPFDKVQEILSSCDVGLAILKKSGNTGGQEGTLGNTKLFEYMQAGLPVICTDFDLWKEIIHKWQCGFCVDPCDIEAIIQAITLILNDRNMAAQMGENGKRAVEVDYNWQTQEKQLINLYQSI